MLGTTRGSINHRIDTGVAADNLRVIFSTIYQYFQDMVDDGSGSIKSIQFGDGGSGTGHPNQVTGSFGDGAHFLVRVDRPSAGAADVQQSYYMHWELRTTSTANTASNPYAINSSETGTGIGVAIAMLPGQVGDTSPEMWAGTQALNGTSDKGDPVWQEPGGALSLFWPPNTGRNGGFEASRENMIEAVSSLGSSAEIHFHIVGDEDNLTVLHRVGALAGYSVFHFGKYFPVSGTSAPYPFFAVREQLPIAGGDTYGTLAANTVTTEGGISLSGDVGVMPLQMSQIESIWSNASFNETDLFTSGSFFLETPFILVNENPGARGLIGIADRFIQNAPRGFGPDLVNGDSTRGYFGANNTSNPRISVPWDGIQDGSSGTLSGGVQFTLG